MAKRTRTGRSRCGGRTPPVGSSISRRSGKSFPRAIDIPRTDIGIIDTIRWKLDIAELAARSSGEAAIEDDLERLMLSAEWSKLSITGRKSVGERLRLGRRSDGARISVYEGSIALEVSAPRALGLLNCEQHLLRESDALQTLDEFRRVLPRTTAMAEEEFGRSPFLSRLDLAVNFDAPIGKLVEAYRSARHPKIRKKADAYGSTGLGWYGSRMDIVLYSLESKIRRSRLTRSLTGKRLRLLKGVARLEVRYKNAEAVGRALKEMRGRTRRRSTSAPVLPCLVPREGGSVELAEIPFTNHELHRQVAREVLRLAGGRSIKLPSGEGDLIRRFGIKHVAENPELMAEVEATYCSKTTAKIRRSVAALHLQDAETGLVRLAWPCPQGRRDQE